MVALSFLLSPALTPTATSIVNSITVVSIHHHQQNKRRHLQIEMRVILQAILFISILCLSVVNVSCVCRVTPTHMLTSELKIQCKEFFVGAVGSVAAGCGLVSSSPCLPSAISTFAARMTAGDLLTILPGTYTQPLTISGLVGSSTNMIKVSGIVEVPTMSVVNSQYLLIEKIRIRGTVNSTDSLSIANCRNITVQRVQIDSASATAIRIHNSPYTRIQDCSVLGAFGQCLTASKSNVGSKIYRGDTSEFQPGLIIYRNRFYECGSGGLLVSTQDAQIVDNVLENKNGKFKYFGIGATGDNILVSGNQIYNVETDAILVVNPSLVRGNIITQSTSGNCIKFRNAGTLRGGLIALYNNTCYVGATAEAGIIIVDKQYLGFNFTFYLNMNKVVSEGKPNIILDPGLKSNSSVYNSILVQPLSAASANNHYLGYQNKPVLFVPADKRPQYHFTQTSVRSGSYEGNLILSHNLLAFEGTVNAAAFVKQTSVLSTGKAVYPAPIPFWAPGAHATKLQ